MKNTLYLLIMIFYPLITFAQLNVRYEACTNCTPNDHNSSTTYTYEAAINFQTTDISSDYGRRDCTMCSDWHLGVDYTRLAGDADNGDHLLNIEEGDVVAFRVGAGVTIQHTAE